GAERTLPLAADGIQQDAVVADLSKLTGVLLDQPPNAAYNAELAATEVKHLRLELQSALAGFAIKGCQDLTGRTNLNPFAGLQMQPPRWGFAEMFLIARQASPSVKGEKDKLPQIVVPLVLQFGSSDFSGRQVAHYARDLCSPTPQKQWTARLEQFGALAHLGTLTFSYKRGKPIVEHVINVRLIAFISGRIEAQNTMAIHRTEPSLLPQQQAARLTIAMGSTITTALFKMNSRS